MVVFQNRIQNIIGQLLSGVIIGLIFAISSHLENFTKSSKYFKDSKVFLLVGFLFDADKLDSIGAIGIGRAFLFAGEIGSKVHNDKKTIENIKETKAYSKEDTAYREYILKLVNIKDLLFTNEGKRIAKERHDFMVEFFNRLNREVDGEI